MDEISKRFFWIPNFRHIFPIFDTLYGRPFVCRFTFLNTARKFVPPANLPAKGPAEEVDPKQVPRKKEKNFHLCLNEFVSYGRCYMYMLMYLCIVRCSPESTTSSPEWTAKNRSSSSTTSCTIKRGTTAAAATTPEVILP